jgi:glycosyltransferase involved in cell wall biosynthesis
VSDDGRPLRIVFVSAHSQLGGSEKVLEDLIGTLPPETVAGVVALQEGPLIDRLPARCGTLVVLPTSASPVAMARSAVRLARRLRRIRPDVVHGNGVKAALVAVAAGRLATPLRPVPVVWMKHDVSLDGPVGRALARRCAAVACVSREVARGLGRSGRTSVVHPGVRVDAGRAVEDAAALRRRLGLGGRVVSVVGRLDPAKGHAELVEVLPDLLSSVPQLTALLVGPDDPHHPGVRAALADRARALGVAERVRLPGFLPSAAVIAASDVLCVPTVPRPDSSGREGFGLVAAEALALGVPVVGYDVGATAEVLDGCGVLVEGGDRRGLARALAGLLSEPGARADLAARGRVRADELTVTRTTERLLDLYREVAR